MAMPRHPLAAAFPGCIQIAGVHDLAEARLVAAAGVHAVGFPLRLAVHAEDLSEPEAAQVAAALRGTPPHAVPVCITYLDAPGAVIALCRDLGMDAVQLHGDVAEANLRALRRLAPDIFVIKSLVVRPDNEAVLAATVAASAPHVDAFITDTFDPATGASGATGKTHDWTVSARLVAMSPRPVILAGGLTPANVRRAIAAVRPAGVDAHTGVEGTDGRKDAGLVAAFVAEARAGFAALAHPRPPRR
ncbi:MAG: phosphoribosylanthranilate isomerase [Desulfovibrionaceae bacterium]